MSFSSKIKLLSSSRKDLKVEILMHVITVEEKAGFYIPKTQDPGHSNIKASTVLCCAWSLSCVQCFVTPWTVAHQAPLKKNTGVSSLSLLRGSPALQADSVPAEPLCTFHRVIRRHSEPEIRDTWVWTLNSSWTSSRNSLPLVLLLFEIRPY